MPRADGRGIDKRHVGGGIRHQHRKKQRLVAGLQVRQHEIFLQVAIEIGDLGVPARYLQFDVGDGGRQQAFETIRAALRGSECRPLVQTRVMQDLVAGWTFRGLGHDFNPQ